MAGLTKPKTYDWKDSNVALIGSQEDRDVKKESAIQEPAWAAVGKCKKPELFVWRIVSFKVEPWPKSEYGQFYAGDSYIVLNAYQEPGSNSLLYDVHFWIGKYSSQDEYGTAAYKTVELDTYLDDKAVQHREVQHYESDLFKSYFGNEVTYLKGGAPTGFKHVETREAEPRLFRFFGDKNVVVKEVKLSKNSLVSGDVFILDLGSKAYQWNGAGSNKNGRWKANEYLQKLNNSRNGRIKITPMEEGDSTTDELLEHLPDIPVGKRDAVDGGSDQVDECTKTKRLKSDATDGGQVDRWKALYQLSDDSGELKFSMVAENSFKRSVIKEDDVYIIDNGCQVFVYVGAKASEVEKKNGLSYAHRYLMDSVHPFNPVTVVNSGSKGKGQEDFLKNFS